MESTSPLAFLVVRIPRRLRNEGPFLYEINDDQQLNKTNAEGCESHALREATIAPPPRLSHTSAANQNLPHVQGKWSTRPNCMSHTAREGSGMDLLLVLGNIAKGRVLSAAQV